MATTLQTLRLCLTAACLTLPLAHAGTYQVIHDFGGSPNGTQPLAGLVRDSAGNLYGTAAYGGNDDSGAVFKVDQAGAYALLHTFHGADGAVPMASLILDQAGNLYGTASMGGAFHNGVVFKLAPSGAYTVLHNFNGSDGASPQASLLPDAAGNLYGTTVQGGASGNGVVFKLDHTGQETVLYSFQGDPDGSEPHANLIQDAAGNFYGTTAKGGASGRGTVFKLDTNGSVTVLHSFTGDHLDGAKPMAGLIRDSAGNFYGTTIEGGAFTIGGVPIAGTVFKLDASGQETVLYSFNYLAGGYTPMGNLIRDSAGNLYGAALGGDNQSCTQIMLPWYIPGCGVVFKLDPAGNETVLYSFSSGLGGDGPVGVIRDPAGNFYGATEHGGASNWGAVFKLDTAGNETVLGSFTVETDGAEPTGLVQDAAGNFYGSTANGGLGPCWSPVAFGCGVVFKIDRAGHETVLYSFLDGADGSGPTGSPVLDSQGNLYGVTTFGGSPLGLGVVYKVDPQGEETVLHTFTGAGAGQGPAFGLVRDSAGNLYGSTFEGGLACYDYTCGVIFKVDSAGRYTVIRQFNGGYGGNAAGALTIDAAGNLYGVADGGKWGQGVVFKLDTAGNYTVLHAFTGNAKRDQGLPIGPLLLDSAGNIYGTTNFNWGSVFKLDPAGNVTILYNFANGAGGWTPNGGLVQDATGNLYGTTSLSECECGVVFKLDPAGQYTVLRDFNNFAGGEQPDSLWLDSAGNLYGTTMAGGAGPCPSGCGVLFEFGGI
jgi:uncharacterized repeat protein (TIGR03803 family)